MGFALLGKNGDWCPGSKVNTMSAVKVLDNVKQMPAYIPGKSGSGENALKLSSNENPFDPLPEVVSAARRALEEVNRYPQMYADDLCQALGERYDLGTDSVVVGNGSVALLNHALTAVAGAGDLVVEPWRSFEAYPIVIGTTQAKIINVPLTESGAEHDLRGMLEAIQRGGERVKAVMLCSPNNPTGPALGEGAVREFLDQVPPQVVVILDEAYIEFVTSPEAVDGLKLLADYPNLVVSRTFSKAYQLAGLRVGWIAGVDPELIGAIRKVSTPFGVNVAAAAAAREALRHEAEVSRQVTSIVDERERVLATLRGNGWKIPDAQGNFYWIGGADLVSPVTSALAAAQITARPFPEGVRITVGLPADNNRVLAALTAL